MDETANSSNQKNSILLSRNNPVALVVGAAGFLGSHLVEKLLSKDIQVVGVDDLENGEKRNLVKATENKNFHMVIESPGKLDLDLPRLDYIFIIPSAEINLNRVLELFKENKCRFLLVSSIDLYEREKGNLGWLKEMESRVARFAGTHNLNARVLRLGPVYGPRMDFRIKDPLIRLISQALNNDLQKDVSSEFSSRALYISDAVDLIVRTIFAGGSAQKIFDGVLPAPIQVAEIKQILMDPVWYEARGFRVSELPPWQTPNLEKTIKTLNWHPSRDIVAHLKDTLNYFHDNEIAVPALEERELKIENRKENNDWDEEKKQALEGLKQGSQSKLKVEAKVKKGGGIPKFPFSASKIYLYFVIALVSYAFIWPALVFGWGILTFHSQLNEGLKNLEKGEFDKGLENIREADAGVAEAKSIFESLDPIRKTNLFKDQFEAGDSLLNLSGLAVSAGRSSILGVQALLLSVKAVTGEKSESPVDYFNTAQLELGSANQDLSRADALVKSEDFNAKLPKFLAPSVTVLSQKLALYEKLASKAQAISILLPKMVAVEGRKQYLVMLQNNMELRPTGGFIGSFAKISFEGGKLKKLEVNDIYAIDGQLSIHVEPPKEIKEDLGQKDWYLRDSNWEPDFPTAARQAEWFYTKETGERVEGVVALDVSAMEDLLTSIGPLDLPDYNEKITADNLFEKAVSHAELSFFAGSQAKKSFLTALTNQLFNKIFFLPQNNWPGIISSLSKSLDEKHISIYLNDTALFSYLTTEGWAHVLPRQAPQKQSQVGLEQDRDFLSLIEANLGANKVNYYLDRNYSLKTVIGKDGQIEHRMQVNYINRSPTGAFPGGEYKNRMRIYLPFGSKLNRVLWGETDITKNVTGFVDYGRSGYSFLLEMMPKEQKSLVLDYSVPIKLDFQNGVATYNLDIIKQAGTAKDPLQWSISYPINLKVVAGQTKANGPQEQTISTDLSIDRSFEVQFRK